MQAMRPTVLAIDDTPANLIVLASALSTEFAFQLANSGAAGLEMAQADTPDLILLDIMMPEMDGYETCRRLKAIPALANVPVVFVTALDDNVSELTGLSLGAADYIYKPIHIDIAQQRIRNLLEREALRREVEQHRCQLEELVASRTAELVRARDAAQVANRAKSTFLANMSHELLTPLNTIQGMNYLVQMRVTDPALREKCHKINDAGKKLEAMFQDILQVSEMDAETPEPVHKAFSPEALLTAVYARMHPKAQTKGLGMVQEIDPRLPKLLCGVPDRIQQILEHFLSNAIKFSDAGQIALRVVAQQEGSTTRQIRFEVADQGSGIVASDLDRIFHAFSQVDDSLTRTRGGIGLGLVLCRHLAQTMGGSIGVTSTPGQGSCFWVSLNPNQGH
jgi:signal transduction histidine kinase